ncbi:hypothetical protein LK533_03330 [Sphingomonas sp. PL-96]|uniref:hypothetical protein n=1 Tax=Sphingomonas sp. PL-96 TaxID=2887201 RepID=UPI001E632157|nr:hypothetical protein [Sphingomonas sp. PL-96]MCC2975707.1 hypothetical protein [Sphingomonas sp. PL-96]
MYSEFKQEENSTGVILIGGVCGEGGPKKLISTKGGSGLSTERVDSCYMSLSFQPTTLEAGALVDRVAAAIHKESDPKRGLTKKQRKAVGAVLADLLKAAACTTGGSAYRPVMAASFKRSPVGRVPFNWVVSGLERLGWLEITKGYLASTKKGAERRATEFKATPCLLAECAAANVSGASWKDHFDLLNGAENVPTVVARATSTKEFGAWGDKRRGRAIVIDRTHFNVARDESMLAEINAFLQRYEVLPPGAFNALTRLYNNADSPGFAYDQGGRLYDLVGNYQRLPKSERSDMRLDGEGVAEIDLQASHMTILRALNGISFDPAKDPYDDPLLPRPVFKSYVSMALGGGSLPNRWSKEAKDDYAERSGGANLQRDFPAAQVRAAVLRAHPFLDDWPTSTIRWGDLQYLESTILLDAVHSLAMHYGIPALPVHDSLIVPRSKIAIADRTLRQSFQSHTGILPGIKVTKLPSSNCLV